jgi:hypothetical protein
MLVAETPCFQENDQKGQPKEGQRYLCLDLLDASFSCVPPMDADCAILVEVWTGGGLLHVDRPVPRDCEAILKGAAVKTRARVLSCMKDERGYVVEITVPAGEPWFPEKYFPPYLLPTAAAEQ